MKLPVIKNAFTALLILATCSGFVHAGPPVAVDKTATPSEIKHVQPAVPRPAARSGIHINYFTVYEPSCGQPLRFNVEVINRTGTDQRVVGQAEIQSEDGRQRVVQPFSQQRLSNNGLLSVSASLPFQINSCGGAPQCYHVRLVMDPDGPQWDTNEARLCITARCTFEVTPATSLLRP